MKKSGRQIRKKHPTFYMVLFFLASFAFLFAIHTSVNHDTTGDEPHYLLMDYSLIHDGDLNLKNNYSSQDYVSFYPHPGLLGPQFNTSKLPKAAYKEYSPHGVGLAFFTLPGFAIAQKNGAVFMMIVLATLVICLTWIWIAQLTKNKQLAYLTSASLLVCYFFNGLAGYLYPDMLIAVLSLICLISFESINRKTAQLILGMALGCLLLVHFKTVTIILPALLMLGYRIRKQGSIKALVLCLITALPFALYFFLTIHQWFGVWNPNALGVNEGLDKLPFNNIGALLFDLNRGLLVYNPILLLLFLGLPIWFRKHRQSFITTFAVVLPSIVVLSFYSVWYGGAAPTGRYIIDFLPALMPAVAFAISVLKTTWQKIAIVLLFAITLGISLDATINKFPLVVLNLSVPPIFQQIQTLTNLDLTRLLPSYNNAGNSLSRHGHVKSLALFMILVSIVVYGYLLSKRPSKRGHTI